MASNRTSAAICEWEKDLVILAPVRAANVAMHIIDRVVRDAILARLDGQSRRRVLHEPVLDDGRQIGENHSLEIQTSSLLMGSTGSSKELKEALLNENFTDTLETVSKVDKFCRSLF